MMKQTQRLVQVCPDRSWYFTPKLYYYAAVTGGGGGGEERQRNQRGKAATRRGRWGKLTLSKKNKEIPPSTYLHIDVSFFE